MIVTNGEKCRHVIQDRGTYHERWLSKGLWIIARRKRWHRLLVCCLCRPPSLLSQSQKPNRNRFELWVNQNLSGNRYRHIEVKIRPLYRQRNIWYITRLKGQKNHYPRHLLIESLSLSCYKRNSRYMWSSIDWDRARHASFLAGIFHQMYQIKKRFHYSI